MMRNGNNSNVCKQLTEISTKSHQSVGTHHSVLLTLTGGEKLFSS